MNFINVAYLSFFQDIFLIENAWKNQHHHFVAGEESPFSTLFLSSNNKRGDPSD
jgi:hypothetical protein